MCLIILTTAHTLSGSGSSAQERDQGNGRQWQHGCGGDRGTGLLSWPDGAERAFSRGGIVGRAMLRRTVSQAAAKQFPARLTAGGRRNGRCSWPCRHRRAAAGYEKGGPSEPGSWYAACSEKNSGGVDAVPTRAEGFYWGVLGQNPPEIGNGASGGSLETPHPGGPRLRRIASDSICRQSNVHPPANQRLNQTSDGRAPSRAEHVGVQQAAIMSPPSLVSL